MADQTEPRTLPAFIIERVEASYNATDAARILDGLRAATDRPVTLRANTLKSDAEAVARALDDAGIAYARTPWYPDAFVLAGARERDVWDLDIYRNGEIYLQSLSSMLPPLALAPRAGADILDMCAAPGGKTSQMAALAGGAARITACELNGPRAEKLEYNLAKLGARNIQVMRCDARKLDTFFSFDQILLDAPCTGSGTVHGGDEKAARRVTQQLLDKVTRSQRALIDRALTVLKPGGTLVYSTCSVLPAENEEIVAAALKRHRDCVIEPIAIEDGTEGVLAIPRLATQLEGTLAVCPTREFEGFYMAHIKRRTRKTR